MIALSAEREVAHRTRRLVRVLDFVLWRLERADDDVVLASLAILHDSKGRLTAVYRSRPSRELKKLIEIAWREIACEWEVKHLVAKNPERWWEEL